MKRTIWLLHIPTSLQEQVLPRALNKKVTDFEPYTLFGPSSDTSVEMVDDEVVEADYVVGLENVNVMKSVSGATRGVIELDEGIMKAFESAEQRCYNYEILPRRLVAAIDFQGDPGPQEISQGLESIKKVLGIIYSFIYHHIFFSNI